MRTPGREVTVVTFAQPEDQRSSGVVALCGPGAFPTHDGSLCFVGKVMPKHGGQAVEVAAPIELLRRLKVAGAAGLERDEEARRLVVVILLPADRQRRGEAFARHEREREIDERKMGERGAQADARCVGIEIRRRIRDAYVVGLDVEVNEVQRVNLLQGRETVMRKRKPVSAILEHVPQHGSAARNRQQRRPLVDGDPGIGSSLR